MKTKDIKELSMDEMNKKLRDFRNELLNLNIRKNAGQVENTGKIRILRKDIARLETIKAQKSK